jgi:cell division protein YceG involved in septum cleavage
VRPDTPPEKWYGNEVPQFYPIAVHAVFGVHGAFQFGHDFGSVAENLRAGKAVQLCLIRPGHYIAAVAYDEERQEIISNDPWPERFPDKNGFNRRLTEGEYRSNVKPYLIVYGGIE